jgi:hypothetical protein
MRTALLLSALLVTLASSASSSSAWAAPARGRSAASRLESAQREFNTGDFAGALKVLDALVQEATDADLLARAHLLRGQVFAAAQDFGQAEEAFREALTNDPEAALDPAKVDPALVKMLDSLRARLKGQLLVRTERPAKISIDGKPAGESPVTKALSIGRHTVSATSLDGRYAGTAEAVVYVKRDESVNVPMTEVPPEQRPDAPPSATRLRPVGELRGVLATLPLSEFGLGLELGGGLEGPNYRGTFHVRVFPEFGLGLRGAAFVPVTDQLRVYAELELPLIFYSEVAFGVGGAGGVEFLPLKVLSVFGEIGGRHYFVTPNEPNQLLVQAGVRLRLP